MKMKKKKNKVKENRLESKKLKSSLARFYIQNPDKAYNAKELIDKIEISNNRDSVSYALNKLVEEGLIGMIKGDKYQLISKSPRHKSSPKEANQAKSSKKVYEGKVDMTRTGAAFMICEDLAEDVYIPAKYTNGALNGDIAQFEVSQMSNRRRPEGEIVSVSKRATETFIGTFFQKGKRYVVSPDGYLYDFEIFIPHEDIGDAEIKDKVVVKVVSWPHAKKKFAEGKVMEVLGQSGNSDIEMKTILVNQGFELEFPEEVLKELKNISDRIPPSEYKSRLDIRDILTFTIDPDTAKDFDDALSYRKLENGNTEIGVHIADVSFYVLPDTALDKDAFKRSTSVYLVDRVLPMLPEKLSNELCSLRPNEDKLTYSAIFEINDKFQVLKKWFGRTVIHSDKRFTYEEAQERIDNKNGDFFEELIHLNQIAKALRKDRFKKGSIDFDAEEVKFRLDENGTPIDVYVKERIDTNMLIEEFMLLANKEVSEFVSTKETPPIPFIYRVHDQPNQDKLRDFAAFAAEVGFKMDISTPKQIAKSLNTLVVAAKKNETLKLLEPMAIRTMAKAVYSAENIGHYGLGFSHYSHFTSPIRRYSDIIAHRILEANIKGTYRAQVDELESKCIHISNQEKRASDAERESIRYKQVEFIQTFIGQIFEGKINGMIDRGIFIELKDNKCEGMIPFDSLSEPFHIEESRLKARGLASGKILKMGQTIKVKIIKTDLTKRQVELEMVEE